MHAKEQWATVILKQTPSIFKLQRSLNALLAPYICIFEIIVIAKTDEVHCKEKIKTYKYQIFNAPFHHVFYRDYYWFVPQVLDIKKMQLASRILIGKNDFQAFRNRGCTAKDTVKTLSSIDWEVIEKHNAKKIHIMFQGSGFLKQMLRNIVGTLVDIGLGKKKIDFFKDCFQKQSKRSMLGKTAPAHALFLEKIALKSEY